MKAKKRYCYAIRQIEKMLELIKRDPGLLESYQEEIEWKEELDGHVIVLGDTGRRKIEIVYKCYQK